MMLVMVPFIAADLGIVGLVVVRFIVVGFVAVILIVPAIFGATLGQNIVSTVIGCVSSYLLTVNPDRNVFRK